MKVRRTAKLVATLQIVLLACAASFHAPVRVEAQAAPERGVFRVTLNGFTVNHESDDIFERDGRGDEIFIISNAWHFLKAEGGAVPLAQIRTKVMGEARGHPGRVSAGSGGLRTGDSFPSNEPLKISGARSQAVGFEPRERRGRRGEICPSNSTIVSRC